MTYFVHMDPDPCDLWSHHSVLYIYENCPHYNVERVPAVNCVDRHAATHPDRIALIWERDEPGHQQYISYK